MIISAVLLPNKDVSTSIVGFSAALSGQTKSLIQLNDDALPHLTLAQWNVESDESEALWHDMEALQLTPPNVEIAGLNFVPSLRHSQVWIELTILKSKLLSEVHAALLQTPFAQSHKLHSESGDRFRPHITVALIEQEDLQIPSLQLSDPSVCRMELTSTRIAVGINGEHFTLKTVRYSDEDHEY